MWKVTSFCKTLVKVSGFGQAVLMVLLGMNVALKIISYY